MKKNSLIFGDNKKYLLDFPDGHFDHIITDPPYNVKIANWDKEIDLEFYAKEFKRILKPNGSLFLFTGWTYLPKVRIIFDEYFYAKDNITYDRIKGRGGKKSLTSTREDLLWYTNNEKNYVFNKDLAYSTIKKKTGGLGLKNGKENRSLSNVWSDISPIVPWSKERVAHPTQKPLQLMERILNVFTNKGDLILDCFAGSGSTLVACENLDRFFVGIENNPEYFEIIKTRLKNDILR